LDCEQRKDLIMLEAAGALDAPEASELRAHLASGCPRCTGALAEAHAVLALVPLGLDPINPPSELRDRLMAKVQGRRQSASWIRLTATAALAACIGALITFTIFWTRVQEKMQIISAPDVQMVSLAGASQPKARGRILWDLDKNKWHVYVFDLQPLPAGKEYELWFITVDQKKVPAGLFSVNNDGKGSLVVDVPRKLGPIALAAITDEPRGGSPQPTGTIQLAGKALP